MVMRIEMLPVIAAVLAGCSPAPQDRPAEHRPDESPASRPADAPEQPPRAADAPPRIALLGESIALAEWRKADNRADCAPIALHSDGGAPDAKARRANFGGGWGVAFDLPGQRSAFGFAGTGLLPEDRAAFAAKVEALERQWPHLRRWGAGENLPDGSAAGYGVMGAAPYPDSNPAGHRLHSIAYLRIPGQACQYNVWSQISRVHLETILGLLRIVGPSGKNRP